MLIDIEILEVQQFISGKADNQLSDCVGSTHFDAGTLLPGGTVLPDGTILPDDIIVYNYENLWLRFKLNIPRKLKSFSWKADYGLALNSPSDVRNQIFGWSFGTENAPGTQNDFTWDVANMTSGLITREMRLDRGTAWFWLTYDYVGQNNCYLKYTELTTLQGETLGSARIRSGSEFKEGTPYVVVDGRLREGQIYVCRGGVWRPGN